MKPDCDLRKETWKVQILYRVVGSTQLADALTKFGADITVIHKKQWDMDA